MCVIREQTHHSSARSSRHLHKCNYKSNLFESERANGCLLFSLSREYNLLKAGAWELGDDAFAMVIEYSLSRARLSARQLKRERRKIHARGSASRLTKAARMTRHTTLVCPIAAKLRFCWLSANIIFIQMRKYWFGFVAIKAHTPNALQLPPHQCEQRLVLTITLGNENTKNGGSAIAFFCLSMSQNAHTRLIKILIFPLPVHTCLIIFD
jgi:hypothetical protein